MREADKKNNKRKNSILGIFRKKSQENVKGNREVDVASDIFRMSSVLDRFDNSEEKIDKDKKSKIKPGRPDRFLIFIIFSLIAIGIIMIFSSSYHRAIERYQDGMYFFTRQLKWTILGFIALFAMTYVFNYKFVKKFSVIGYWFSIILLAGVLVWGIASKGATRWYDFGGFNFQPSEIAKILLILALSYELSKKKAPTKKEDVGISAYKKIWIMILIPAALIFVENLSTGIVVAFTGIIMVSISGFKLEKWLIFLGIPCVIFLILFIKIGGIGLISDVAGGKYKKRLERFEVWLDPWEDPTDSGFQVVQSLYAIGSGGIFGVGLGKSKQKLGYIPEAHNDIIFAIICEEFGLIGASVVLLLFIILISRCISIAIHAPDKYSMYYTIGMASLIALQVIVNVGVVTNTLPATGMPLPFISYGGTSLLLTMVGMGIVLNISRYTNQDEINEEKIEQNEHAYNSYNRR